MGLSQFNQLSIFSDEDPNCINYQPSSYFQDLRIALEEATQLICIAGWAVWDKLHLLRGNTSVMKNTLTSKKLLCCINKIFFGNLSKLPDEWTKISYQKPMV